MLMENVIVLATFAVAIGIVRFLLERELRASHPAKLADGGETIRPVELSFLASAGDLSDVSAVLAVDLLQRAVKSKLSGSNAPQLVDYEEKLWLVTKRYVSDSATDIIGSVTPDKIMSDPLGYWRRISMIYKVLIKLVRTFTHEVIADPRRLRKYFSIGWITRLVLDFSSSDFRERLRRELVSHLTDKGLIVEREKRIVRSRVFMVFAVAVAIVCGAFVFFELGALAASMMLVSAAITAGLLRTSFYLVGFLPLYSELSSVLDHVVREDWRINAIRLVIRLLKVLGFFGLIFIFLSGTVTGWLAVDFVMQQISLPVLYMQLCLVITLFLATDMFWRGVEIANSEVATTIGEACLKQVRSRLSKIGPMGAFREMLEDVNYDPSFSEIVAVYGIEPLLFLA
jgi:hypothetical protein